jgi:hypothetical protein
MKNMKYFLYLVQLEHGVKRHVIVQNECNKGNTYGLDTTTNESGKFVL